MAHLPLKGTKRNHNGNMSKKKIDTEITTKTCSNGLVRTIGEV